MANRVIGLALGVTAATLLACGMWVQLRATPAAAGGADVAVSQGVRDQIAAEGQARVIVEVRLPSGDAVPEGKLSTAAAVLAQRADIAAAQSQVLARLQGHDHTLVHRFETVPYMALEVKADALAELEAAPFHVQRVVEDALHFPSLYSSVPLIQGPQAWAAGYDGTGITVAILDTGVDRNHVFLSGKVVAEACFSGNLCPSGQTGPGTALNCSTSINGCFHGTHVAGIAAGKYGTYGGQTFGGVAKGASIMAVQVFTRFDTAGSCGSLSPPCVAAYTSDIMAGLNQVYSLRAQYTFSSANLSLGGGLYSTNCDSDPMKASIDNLRSVGIATVIASGNDGSPSSISSPACISTAVSVGSTTNPGDAISSFSNSASFLSLLAPGDQVLSSYPGGAFVYARGTSMATPHVTGAWAVLKQASPGASVATILSALQSSGLPVTDSRNGITKSRIRLAQALSALAPAPPPPAPASLSVSPTSVVAGGLVTATWSGIASPAATDWIGLFAPGAGDTSYLAWMYVSCSQVPGVAQSSGSCSFTVPGTVPAGTYQLRLFSNNGYTRLATSNSLTVTAGGGSPTPGGTTLGVSPTTVARGASVTATWSGIVSPTALDWIGLYPSGAADTAYVAWIYVSCVQAPSVAKASGSCAFTIPGTVAGGTYELRLLANNGYTRLAVSNAFTVTTGAATPASLSVSPTSVLRGSGVTATWSGIASPTALDWIGLSPAGAANTAYVTWIYVSCTQAPSVAKASGSCAFTIPATVAAGTYELRLFANNGYTRLATSNALTVTVAGR